MSTPEGKPLCVTCKTRRASQAGPECSFCFNDRVYQARVRTRQAERADRRERGRKGSEN